MKRCEVGVRETVQYRAESQHKGSPAALLKGVVWAPSDFPRNTYLLLCEEDVSVAQLKTNEAPLPPDFRLLSHPSHPSLSPTSSQLKDASEGCMEDRCRSYRNSKQ